MKLLQLLEMIANCLLNLYTYTTLENVNEQKSSRMAIMMIIVTGVTFKSNHRERVREKNSNRQSQALFITVAMLDICSKTDK